MPLEIDSSAWSGEGTFTALLIDRLRDVAGVRFVRVEDAPATRSAADYNFISNELYVGFETIGDRWLGITIPFHGDEPQDPIVDT